MTRLAGLDPVELTADAGATRTDRDPPSTAACRLAFRPRPTPMAAPGAATTRPART